MILKEKYYARIYLVYSVYIICIPSSTRTNDIVIIDSVFLKAEETFHLAPVYQTSDNFVEGDD